MKTTPYWLDGVDWSLSPLSEDIHTEVLVIGAGITGLTTAWLLAREGVKVVLVDREDPARRDTGHTTAHLTYMTDTRLSDLVAAFGRREALLAWQAGAAAMDLIRQTVGELALDCELKTVPGYLVAAEGDDIAEERAALAEEAEWARQAGFDVRLIDEAPVTGRPGIRFADQMEFHPIHYLQGLASEARSSGARIFANTEVTAFEDEPRRVKAGQHWIHYERVVIATHVPLQGNAGTLGAALFQTKLALYSSYAIAARIPAVSVTEMIWSDTADPFLYLRMHRSGASGIAILGGEDHKTGQAERTDERFRRLEQTLAKILPEAVVTHRWSGQVVETVDGLPYIGEAEEGQFVATGFSGNGMTFGTTAAMMARDWVNGTRNPWSKLFEPGRKTGSAVAEYLKENADFPARMVTGRLKVKKGDPEDLAPGEGRVMTRDGKRVAACRDASGEVHLCSAVCPHLGCIVAWNAAESTWDCPCHGSRFTAAGKVIAGPAERDLKAIETAATP
jgi:glycine/D-amino acid oxidase-like deaminating enzyme/nitrite reductase/ring-hydroxylating ferredoxin subunit